MSLASVFTSAVQVRREIHADPGVAFDVESTLEKINAFLSSIGLEGKSQPCSPGGMIVDIEGSGEASSAAPETGLPAVNVVSVALFAVI